jgi:LPXTG-motif cell wall-anchored protein
MLPETASIVPLLGLLGGAFLSLGLIVAGVRRRLG